MASSHVRGVVGGGAIATVHKIIRHDLFHELELVSTPVIRLLDTHVDEIDNSVDQGDLLRSVGNHVPLQTRDSDGELLVTDGILDLLQELGEALDLRDLLGVGDTLVVLAVATRVLPVDILVC